MVFKKFTQICEINDCSFTKNGTRSLKQFKDTLYTLMIEYLFSLHLLTWVTQISANHAMIPNGSKFPFAKAKNIFLDKAQKIVLFSFPGTVPVIFHWISEGLCNSSFIEEIFNINIEKKRSTWVFFAILWIPWSWIENFHNLKCP